MSADKTFDLASIRARLGGRPRPPVSGAASRSWPRRRSSASSCSASSRQHASEWLDPVGRRGFLKLMGASLALAGATACTRQPDELIVPYVRQPEDVVPGKPLFFATAMTLGGVGDRACWPRATRAGRPRSKAIPITRRASARPTLFGQALGPDSLRPGSRRSRSRTSARSVPGAAFVQVDAERSSAEQTGAAGRRAAHPHRADRRRRRWRRSSQELLAALPAGEVAPVRAGLARQRVARARALAFGEPVDVHYRFDQADVIVVARRRPPRRRDRGQRPLRARLRQRPPRAQGEGRDEPAVRGRADADADRLDRGPSPAGRAPARSRPSRARCSRASQGGAVPPVGAAAIDKCIAAAAKDLQGERQRRRRRRRRSAAARRPRARARDEPGARQRRHDGRLHRSGAARRRRPDRVARARSSHDMNAGKVQAARDPRRQPGLHGAGRPDFARGAEEGATRVHVGLYDDETAALCHWHVPATHFLEEWSDARALRRHGVDRAAADRAALPGPLGARGAWPSFSARPERTGLRRREGATGRRSRRPPGQDFEKFWRRVAARRRDRRHGAAARRRVTAPGACRRRRRRPPRRGGFEIVFAPDPTIYDGRFANNGWLQELPKPLTKLTWDNAALIVAGDGRAARRRRTATSSRSPYSDRTRERAGLGAARARRRRGHGAPRATAARARAASATAPASTRYALRTSDAPWFGVGARARARPATCTA